MNVRVKYPIGHPDGRVIPAGAMAEFPANLARMLIARGQAESSETASAEAASAPVSATTTPAPKAAGKSAAVP